MKDWGQEKDYMASTRQHMWNNDYFEFLVKCVWKIDKPVKIIDFAVYMEKIGLKNVGVRINDYVNFITQESEKDRFLKDNGVDSKHITADACLASRCHIISYGTK